MMPVLLIDVPDGHQSLLTLTLTMPGLNLDGVASTPIHPSQGQRTAPSQAGLGLRSWIEAQRPDR